MAVKKIVRPAESIGQRLQQFVAAHPDLDGVDVRIYVYLSSLLNFDEYLHVRQITVALFLKRNKTHISRSFKKLTELGIIEHSEDGPRASEWRLSTKFESKRKARSA
jgi:predicted transcriptional regulator